MTKEIKLTKGMVALVDDEDYGELSKHSWTAQKANTKWYAVGRGGENGKRVRVQMHRVIMNCPEGMIVDHINRDSLDNRKENLRICNHTQNNINSPRQSNNTTGYTGVSKHKSNNRYYAEIGRKRMWIGSFKTAEEAARAYDKKAIEIYGEFAVLNFPNDVALAAQGEGQAVVDAAKVVRQMYKNIKKEWQPNHPMQALMDAVDSLAAAQTEKDGEK